jgi:hyperosmotically inducible protein
LWFTPAHAEWRSDAWITTKTKMALLTTEGVSSTAINVDTVDGRVTLHGKVETGVEKDKAVAAAQKIEGAKEVRNLIQVVPAAAKDVVKASDADLTEKVKTALAADHSLDNSSIKVQSVNSGVVLLAGKANSLTDHLRALEVARAVPGVQRVTTEVESPDKIADDEIRKDHAQGSTKESTTAKVSDAWITSAVKLRLMANGDTPALDINVDTQNGAVTLFGLVPSETSKVAAAAEAKKVSGVRVVHNDLQVVPKSAQNKVEVKDDELTRKVNEAIDQREVLSKADIDVEVKNGVVRLTGTVPNESLRLVAATTARSISGVRSVHDELKLAPQG